MNFTWLVGHDRYAAGRVGERDRELVADRRAVPVTVWPDGSVTVDLRAGGGAPPRPRPLGIQHALHQLQSLQARREAGEIAGRRMALRAAAGAVEVLLAGVGVAGLQIRDLDRAAVALERCRLRLRVVNERDDGGEVGVGQS